MPHIVTLAEIQAAADRISGVAVRTGLYLVDPARLRAAGAAELPFALYIKAESEQPIGSFKLRGAYNRIAQLAPEELKRGVITYSSGNHAQGVAYAARALGAKAVIVMPRDAPVVKIEATRALGAGVVLVGPASSERKAKAEELAEEHGYTVIPPYDDPAIIAGQGTCGLEILEQLGLVAGSTASPSEGHRQKGSDGRGGSEASGSFDYGAEAPSLRMTGSEGHAEVVVLSPVSGGGLLGGISTAIKLACSSLRAEGALGTAAAPIQVWGAEPELAADAKESFDTRTLVEWPAAKTTRTISDGLRTQSLGALNFEHILRFVDGIVTVTEDEIVAAMRLLLAATGLVAEPSGAVTLAAALYHHAELPKCARMVAVLSGGNIEPGLRQRLESGVATGASA